MNAFEYIQGQPWAMLDSALESMLAIVESHGETVRQVVARAAGDPEAVNARAGRLQDNTKGVRVRDGVAEIAVRGPIARYMNLFSDICGGTSVQTLATDLQAAVDNPHVRAVLLHVDSPGGQATGIGEMAAMIRKATASKPVVAYVGGLGCSAAYWLAAACSEVVVAPTASLGSVGVVLQLDARSRPGEVKFVSSQSPLKQADPNTDAGRTEIQEWVDALAEVFIEDVAMYRGTNPGKVARDFGRGGVKVGKAAVAAGMADGVGDFETTLARLSRGLPAAEKPEPKPEPGKPAAPKPRGTSMTLASLFARLIAKSPEAVAAAMSEEDGADAGANLGQLAGRIINPPAPPAPPVDVEAVKAQARADALAEFQAENRKALATLHTGQAEAFVDRMVKAGKVKPAESAALVAAYVDAALTDTDRGPITYGTDGAEKATRLSLFTASIEARGESGMLQEKIPADATEAAGKLAGFKTLPQTATDGEDAKAKASEKRIAEMLGATDAGRAALAASQK